MNVFYFLILSLPASLIASDFGDAWGEDGHFEISEAQAQPSVQEESRSKLCNVKTECLEPKKIEEKKTEETVTERQINWFNLGSGLGLGVMSAGATSLALNRKEPFVGAYAAGCAYAAYLLLKYSVTSTTAKVEKPAALQKPKPAPKRKIIFEFDEDDWMTP